MFGSHRPFDFKTLSQFGAVNWKFPVRDGAIIKSLRNKALNRGTFGKGQGVNIFVFGVLQTTTTTYLFKEIESLQYFMSCK